MTINTEIAPELKRKSEEILKRLGLTFSEAIQLFLKQVIVYRGLPFEMNIPNEETRQALVEVEQKDTLEYFEKRVSLTLDEDILQAVDTMTKTLNMTRSAFTQYALQLALQQYRVKELEEKHKQGYLRKPVVEGEFSDWEDEQEWGDV